MKIRITNFQWDAGNLVKCQKHGVSLEEVERLLSGDVDVVYDIKHSLEEERYVAVGYGSEKRPMLVVFALKGDENGTVIWPISARFMHKKEAKRYEKAHPKA